MQKITSSFLSLDSKDFLKGLVVAAGSSVAAIIGDSFSKGVFTLDITIIWHTAAAAAVAYLAKQFFTGAKAITPVQ